MFGEKGCVLIFVLDEAKKLGNWGVIEASY